MALIINDYATPSAQQWRIAIDGMRNSWESWEKGDSYISLCGDWVFGAKDKQLLKQLLKAGPDHAKAARQFFLIATVTAPDYWWRQLDQYRVGVDKNRPNEILSIGPDDLSTNSTSQMHTLGRHAITEEHVDLSDVPDDVREQYLNLLNGQRERWLEAGKRKGPNATEWRGLLQLMPAGWIYRRTVATNYQAARAMYHARKNHREGEWRDFCKWLETIEHSWIITEEF
jgi:hypothetical protein